MCQWKNCGGEEFSGGLCSVHYNRLRRTGTCEPSYFARRPFSERLWAKIDKAGPDDCWEWTAAKVSGYGKLGRGGRGGGDILAHRAVWEQFNGPIPDSPDYHGRVVMHTCDNRACCNPAHLRLGTQAENVRDMDKKGRRVNTPRQGEAHHKAKLTEDDIRSIRATPPGVSYKALGKLYGVSDKMIGYIIRRQHWKHIA